MNTWGVYACMCLHVHARMNYVYMYVFIFVSLFLCIYSCVFHACLYVCMNVCTYTKHIVYTLMHVGIYMNVVIHVAPYNNLTKAHSC